MKRKYFYLLLAFLVIAFTTNINAQVNTSIELPEGAIARFGKGGINAMQFSPDGTQLVIGTSIGVWLYDVEDGNGKVLQSDSVRYIDALVYSSNGKILAVHVALDKFVLLWNLETLTKLSVLKIPKNYSPEEIVFSEDNKKLIGLNMNGMIEWNIETGISSIRNIEDPTLSVFALEKYGSTFVIGDMRNGKIRQWNPDTESLGLVYSKKQQSGFERFLSELFGRRQDDNKGMHLNVIALSSDGKTVASAHGDNKIRLWNTTTGVQRIDLKGHTQMINVITFSKDNTMLASGGEDSKIMLWDVRKGRKRGTLTGHQGNIKTLAFSPTDDNILASGGADGTVRLWNIKNRKEQTIITTGHPESVEAIAFNSDNTTIYSAISNGTIHGWNVQTGEEKYSPIVVQENMFYEFDFSKDASLFISHGADSTVYWDGYYSVIEWDNDKKTKLLSLPTGDVLATFPQYALAVTVSPDNTILAADTRLNGVELWNIKTRKKMFGWIVADSVSRKLIFSNDSKLLAAYGYGIPTQVWNVKTKREITPSEIKEASVIAFSPDNSKIALKHSDGIDMWMITTKKLQKFETISKKDYPINDRLIIFCIDGKYLLGRTRIGPQSGIRVWEIHNKRELGTFLSGHTGVIETLTFSHDGKILASGSLDGTILLWDWELLISNIIPSKAIKK